MATATKLLSLAEFEAEYSDVKPYYEFWHGEAIQKSMANLTHSLLQTILSHLLRDLSYKAASELKFKIDPDLQPVPDVVASKGRIEGPIPPNPSKLLLKSYPKPTP